MLEFTDKTVGTATVELPITENDIANVIINGIEGSIGYWAQLDNTGELWESKPAGEPASTWATKLILEGKSVDFADELDNNKVLSMTLDKLLKGIAKNAKERPFDSDIENGDSITYDCIFQYALLGDVEYG